MSRQTAQDAHMPLPVGARAVYQGGVLADYEHADELGSARLASPSSRTLYSSTAYAPFGHPYDQTGAADPSFTGQRQHYGGDQYNFLKRMSPIQGRW